MDRLEKMVEIIQDNIEMPPAQCQLLQKRLKLAWSTDSELTGPWATVWRKRKARMYYQEIQDHSQHLFLPFLLSFSPTECASISFRTTIQSAKEWRQLHCPTYRLSPGMQQSITRTVEQLELIEHVRYHSLRAALFIAVPGTPIRPRDQADHFADDIEGVSPAQEIVPPELSTTITGMTQYMFSKAPTNIFPESDGTETIPPLQDGLVCYLRLVQKSNLWRRECAEANSETNCVTVIIPEEIDQDATISFRVPYQTAFWMRSALQLRLVTHL